VSAGKKKGVARDMAKQTETNGEDGKKKGEWGLHREKKNNRARTARFVRGG